MAVFLLHRNILYIIQNPRGNRPKPPLDLPPPLLENQDLYDNLNFTLLYTVYNETGMFLVIVDVVMPGYSSQL